METSDLQTGDYIRHKRTKNIIWVFEIDNDRKVINNEPDGYCSERNISINDIEPVHLTREILEKNGFVFNPEWHCASIEVDGFDIYTQLGYANKIEYIRINELGKDNHIPSVKKRLYLPLVNYVHELQHALRLCGIKKEIKLED